MKYKYFLFDWDGSLANTLEDWFRVHKDILIKNGVEVTDELVRQETFGKLDASELGITDTEKYLSEIETEILPSLNEAKLNDGVLELLKEIKKQGGKIGVVTDSKKKWVKHALRNNGLRDLVDVFLAREDVTERKPDSEIIMKALAFMKGKTDEALMIGDNWRDISAARVAGVDSVLYFPASYEKYYHKDAQKILRATYIVKSFEELKEII